MKTLFLPFALLLSFNFSSAQSFFSDPMWTAYTPPFPDTVGIVDIHVVSENVIWAVGVPFAVDDTFFHDFTGDITYSALTTDGGDNWSIHTVPMGDNPFVTNITATDGSTAWVAGLDDSGDSKVLKTTDGGATWIDTDAPFDPNNSWVNYVHAFSSTDIIALGDPIDDEFEIYKSSDGGQTWNKVPDTNIPGANDEFGLNNRADAVGDHIWFGTNDGRVYRSANRGLNWQASSTNTYSMVAMSFSDANNGVIADQLTFHPYPDGLEANIYHTADGGMTWTNITPPLGNHAIRITGIEYVPDSAAIVMGISDTSVLTGPFSTWVSLDRGMYWMQVSTGENIVWPTFLNAAVGWAGESQPVDHKTQLFKHNPPLVGLFSPNQLVAEVSVLPNPASDEVRVHVQARETGDFWVLLNDAQGRLIKKETEDGVSEFDKTFEIKNLPAGTYTLTVTGAKGSLTRKLVKQ